MFTVATNVPCEGSELGTRKMHNMQRNKAKKANILLRNAAIKSPRDIPKLELTSQVFLI